MRQEIGRRSNDMAAYALYNTAVERGSPFLSEQEVSRILRESPYEFLSDATPKNIVHSLEAAGLIRVIEGFGVEVLACPYIPKQALKEGREQEEWFSGKRRGKLLRKFLKGAE